MDGINHYLQEAAMENRDGVLNLAKGNLAEGMEILRNAASILDQLLLLPTLSLFDTDDGIDRCCSIQLPFLKNDSLYSYNRALVFCHPTLSLCSVTEVSWYRAIVLFNMALACQMKGVALKDKKSSIRSLHLYYACLRVSCFLPTGSNANHDLLRVAALNNQAIAMVSMFDYERAKIVLDELRSNWRHVLVLHCITGAFRKEDIEGFRKFCYLCFNSGSTNRHHHISNQTFLFFP